MNPKWMSFLPKFGLQRVIIKFLTGYSECDTTPVNRIYIYRFVLVNQTHPDTHICTSYKSDVNTSICPGDSIRDMYVIE